MKRTSIAIGISLALLGCSSGQKTLGDLSYQPKKEKEIVFENLTHQEVRKEYQELLSLFKDDELKEQIERRIADVYMIEGGNDQLKETVTQPKSYYAEAIKSYQNILKKYPNSPDNADVLYQLARAYDMEGEQDKALEMLTKLTRHHPNYKNNSEAHFRKADILYSKKEYRQAEHEYKITLAYNNPKLNLYANYMLGWSQYKQLKYENSLDAFVNVLNTLMQRVDSQGELSKAEKPLAEETLKSISLGLSKYGGAEYIEDIDGLSGKDYIWMVYNSLGQYFLDKERYEDSAQSFRAYVNRYNFTAKAPELHSHLISTYIKGGFPLQALQEKETYVGYYGIGSEYERNVGSINAGILSQLKIYINELAKHYHSEAQLAQKERQKLEKRGQPNSSMKSQLDKLTEVESKGFNQAAHFYSEYLRTFPTDKRVGEITYLRAEVLFQAGRYKEAVTDYENVAYQLKDKGSQKNGANAGYAAIISYDKHLDSLSESSQEHAQWKSKAVESMLRFASVYHTDNRSPSVLTNAAEYLFSLQQYERALEVAQQLINKTKKLDKNLKKTAYGIMAHSNFKLERYSEAEKNYVNQRQLVKKGSGEHKAISERLAVTIYKNSEVMVANDDKASAITELLKIVKLTPDSSVRVTAQYDASRLMLGAERWSEAINLLKELIQLFPKYEHANEFPRKLAFAYEQNKNWLLAAQEYEQLSKNDKDEEVKRNSLFLSASMYRKNKNYDTAIKLFRKYARTYEQPFDVRMEARFNLADLYEKTDEKSKQLFWLRRIIEGDAKGGNQRTERSRWLGAWANIKYGDYFAFEFKRKRLTLPLAKSLPRKNEAMRDAVQRYQQAADYGILEFVTMSSVKMAGLYQQLVKELKRAPVPSGLSTEEKSAYRGIIEEQAAPLMDTVVELHQGNINRAWEGEYDKWIEKSYQAMKELRPARYAKSEIEVSYGDEIW
ncbi:tetratricopeptide repeat protein [Pleionea sediminis]|uniref:tetratricopeptide repeat protein n=1 Tax=Pleionea sediminis TaxID=2569479 RepID=UPI001184A97A|nr:tetratricopeptide repeat protein [Pleionea sediminis]